MSRLVYGVGINDMPRGSCSYINDEGKQVIHPWYKAWKAVLQRAYCPKAQTRFPTYAGSSVCGEWHTLSNFKLWFDETFPLGAEGRIDLDKDIVVPGNKVYGPHR